MFCKFRSIKRGIKAHTQIDLRGPIPVCVFVSPASMHELLNEAGSFCPFFSNPKLGARMLDFTLTPSAVRCFQGRLDNFGYFYLSKYIF